MGCTFSSQKHKGEETSTHQKADPGNGNKEWITNPSAETGQLKKQPSASGSQRHSNGVNAGDLHHSSSRKRYSTPAPTQSEKLAVERVSEAPESAGDEASDWDRFSSGDFSDSEPSAAPVSQTGPPSGYVTSRARNKETSLFGLTDKKARMSLRETGSLKLAKLGGCTFVNQYVVIKYLGRGACGRVFLCMDMGDNRLYAVKIVKKMDLERSSKTHRRRRNPIDDLRREVSIMRQLRHRNIVSLQEVVDDPSGNKMLLVMDYMEGGPVMTREALERGRRIAEPLALQYFRDMCKALDYLHYNKVVHGDLKPENVLMSARGNVTLSDFGCSKVIISGNEYLERCNGTPAFLAPEMMKPHSRYRGRPTDIYALGACLYTFVFGRIPFNAPNVFKLFQVVQHEPLKFPEDVHVSYELRDLLLRMLAKDPKQRLTLRQVMRHPWVTRRNAWPLRTVREMLLHGEDPSAPPVLPDLMSTFNVLDIPRQDHLLEVLKPGLQERSYQDQEYLIRQGEQGTYMLYIMQGQVEVLLRLPSHTHRGRRHGGDDVDDSMSQAGSTASTVPTVHQSTMAEVIGDDLPPALLEGASKAKDFTETLARGPRESLVALRTEGQFVGEMGLFTTACIRCASVRAKGPVTVKVISGDRLQDCIDRNPEARQQVQEMVWMKQSENMVLEAMTRLSTVHDALEEMLRSDNRGGQAGLGSQHAAPHSLHSSSFGARRF